MKTLVLALIAISSFNALAIDPAVKCAAEYREVQAAQRVHIRATDKVAADSQDTVDYVSALAENLIAQPNTRVGGYGYSVKRNADIARGNVNSLTAQAKAKEELVHEAMLRLEDCLYGITSAETSGTEAE